MEIKSLVGGLLAGAAIGVAIGILLAPTSGEETRNKIAKRSKLLVDDLKNVIEQGTESLKNQSRTAIDKSSKWLNDGVSYENDHIKV